MEHLLLSERAFSKAIEDKFEFQCTRTFAIFVFWHDISTLGVMCIFEGSFAGRDKMFEKMKKKKRGGKMSKRPKGYLCDLPDL